ncbi:MAG: hypothetical protein MJZ61_01800, partial [Bacteroidales bacterium]|nr:hypothetical protein [Bacteroidales bacterium]
NLLLSVPIQERISDLVYNSVVYYNSMTYLFNSMEERLDENFYLLTSIIEKDYNNLFKDILYNFHIYQRHFLTSFIPETKKADNK